MIATFITAERNQKSGWDVVKKRFPAKDAYLIAKETLEHFNDQNAAEAAAIRIATASDLTFVPEKQGVIIIATHFGFYMPKLLTPEGSVIEKGVKTDDIEEAIREAKSKAKEGNFAFIPYKPLII